MSKRVLVSGGGIAEVQAALDLADSGIPVTLVAESPSLHSDGNIRQSLIAMPSLLRAANHPNIRLETNATVSRVRGKKGDFKVWVNRQPRYVDPALCTSCGKCERECPVTILSQSTSSEEGHKAIHRPAGGLKSVPSALCVEKQGIPPCTNACPAGVNAHGYIALISQGKFAEALNLITDSVPFPRVLGRVCNHDCETECTRGDIDMPVSICALKRFAADASPVRPSLESSQSEDIIELDDKARVAIIGAGPAGLTAARDLARLGHRSTVFEAMPAPGGMITVGMPRFRLPRDVRQADIDDILGLGGIEIRTSTVVGKDITIDDLRSQGYEAILIAVGAHKNQRLGIQGETLKGVINSITFLEAFNLNKSISIGSRIIVIGGGYTGIDSARTAVRLVSSIESAPHDAPAQIQKHVLCVDRCAKEDLPANPDEVAEAEAEGVEFDYLVAPVRIIGNNGRVTGVKFRRMKKDKAETDDESSVVPIEGSEFTIEADTVIVAVGQRPDLSFLKGETALTEGQRHMIVDRVTQAAKIPGIFAAGDAAHECGPMINAIAAGRRAATYIDKYLRGEEISRVSRHRSVPVRADLDTACVLPIERHPMPLLPIEDRTSKFEEVELGFSRDMAVEEALRCLHCGDCSECLQCQQVCELGAVNLKATAERLKLDDIAAIVVARTGDSTRLLPPDISQGRGVYTLGPSSGEEASVRGSALAARIMVDLAEYRQLSGETRFRILEEAHEPKPPPGEGGITRDHQRKKAVFVCGCGGSISDFVDIPGVVSFCNTMKDVVYSGAVGYACSDEAAVEINRIIKEKRLTDVIVAGCACCNLDQICFSCSDRRIRCKTNLLKDSCSSDVSYEFVNIREHCAWVHQDDPATATAKAGIIIGAGVARSGSSPAISCESAPVEPRVLVIGTGSGCVRAAEYLASQGFVTTIVTGSDGADVTNLLAKKGVHVITDAEISDIYGGIGRYTVTVAGNGGAEKLLAGVIIIDTGDDTGGVSLPPPLKKLVDEHGNRNLPSYSVETILPDIFICASNGTSGESRLQGEVIACRAAVLLNRGKHDIEQKAAYVDEQRCRGCGTCVSICPYDAPFLTENNGISIAAINQVRCRGCGLCVSHCPSGALSQGGCTDEYITASLEAILS